MGQSLFSTYRAMAQIQETIAAATTLGDALKEGLRIIGNELHAENAVIWYAEENERTLSPYFWLASTDFTGVKHNKGDGAVGRAFGTRETVRFLSYEYGTDPLSEKDFSDTRIRSMILVPFWASNKALGVLQFVNKAGGGLLTDIDADVCTMLAMHTSSAIAQNEALMAHRSFGKPILEVRDVTREYKDGDSVTKVLKGVNLNVYDGELLVILGPSGCGKSTLMHIMAGLDRPNAGSVRFLGKEIVGASKDELTKYRRDNLGFVFQNYNLMPNLNAKQNLDLIAELVSDPLSTDDALEMMGLLERKDKYPSQLSGGQQQRVSIARALVKRPRIVFADEPTTALDYPTAIEVLSVMERVVSKGTTLVMVTHNEEICRMADRVIRMRNGLANEMTVNRARVRASDLVW